MFGIRFGELDAVVRVMHGISPDNAALVARFKYMQRMGFPEGVNSGRGVRSIYGLPEILKVLIAFELLETGATPTRVVRMLRTDWDGLGRALAVGWLAARERSARADRLMLCAMPGAFRELGEQEDPLAPVAEPLRAVPLAKILEWLRAIDEEMPVTARDVVPSNGPRRLVVDPMRLAAALRALVPTLTGMSLEQLDEAYLEFGGEVFNGAPEETWTDAAGSSLGQL